MWAIPNDRTMLEVWAVSGYPQGRVVSWFEASTSQASWDLLGKGGDALGRGGGC